MPCKSLVFVLILLSCVLFGDSKAIENQNFRSNTISSAPRIEIQPTNENSTSKVIKSERPRGRMMINNSNEKNSKLLAGNKQLCPYKSKELCLIFSLSKIAKIQADILSQDSTNYSLKLNTLKGVSKDSGSLKLNQEMGRKGGNLHFDFNKQIKDRHFPNFSEKQMKSSNVHCGAIQDVYIPAVKQNLPAFACKFGNSTFILSSERFIQDRRSYLDMKIDEDAFKNVIFTPKLSKSNKFDVIPALLVLNVANNDYRIEMHKNVSNERKIDQAEGNR